jgi:predicted ArsR family transcriptional regulator
MGDERQTDWVAWTRKHTRKRGHATSVAAAQSMEKTAGSLCVRIFKCIRDHGSATHSEIAARLGMTPEQIHKRLSDLEEDDLIIASGITRPGPSGREQTVWKIK